VPAELSQPLAGDAFSSLRVPFAPRQAKLLLRRFVITFKGVSVRARARAMNSDEISRLWHFPSISLQWINF
jgi:hypothetical protein